MDGASVVGPIRWKRSHGRVTGSRAVSSAVSFSRHSVDVRVHCYETDAQDLA